MRNAGAKTRSLFRRGKTDPITRATPTRGAESAILGKLPKISRFSLSNQQERRDLCSAVRASNFSKISRAGDFVARKPVQRRSGSRAHQKTNEGAAFTPNQSQLGLRMT